MTLKDTKAGSLISARELRKLGRAIDAAKPVAAFGGGASVAQTAGGFGATDPGDDWFLVEILSIVDAEDRTYTFKEIWLDGDGDYVERPSGRTNDDDTPAVLLSDGFPPFEMRVGSYAFARRGRGAGGLQWELLPIPVRQETFHARLTSVSLGVWSFVPLKLNSSGVYVDDGDELTGARQLADPDTPTLPAITDIVPGTRVLMRRAATLDGTGEPQYEFRCTLPTVTACNIAPSERFAIATYGQPEELGLPTVCLGEIELPGPGLYLLYATAYASLRMNGMPSVQYGPNLTCATMYFDADDLGIVDGSHLPSAVLTTLATSATLDWVGNSYTPSGVSQEVNWGSGTIMFAHRSEDGAAVRLWGHCGNWSGFETGPGAGRIPAYGEINNLAFGFVPLSGMRVNETCNACDSPPPDSGSGGGGGGSETFYCFELGDTVTMTASNRLGTCTGIPDEIELTRYTDPGAYEYEWRGEFEFEGETYTARITCPSTINPWGVTLGLGGETVTPVSQDEGTLTLVWDMAFGVGSACIGSARLTMVGSG